MSDELALDFLLLCPLELPSRRSDKAWAPHTYSEGRDQIGDVCQVKRRTLGKDVERPHATKGHAAKAAADNS